MKKSIGLQILKQQFQKAKELLNNVRQKQSQKQQQQQIYISFDFFHKYVMFS